MVPSSWRMEDSGLMTITNCFMDYSTMECGPVNEDHDLLRPGRRLKKHYLQGIPNKWKEFWDRKVLGSMEAKCAMRTLYFNRTQDPNVKLTEIFLFLNRGMYLAS